MIPTFFGLNTVTRALLAQQEAVDVINQNISNANTPGYSQQDPLLQATDPYTSVAFNRPSLAGQLGTGSQVVTIVRSQSELLNSQIRVQNQGVGQFQAMDNQFTQIQAIYNDPSSVAINSAATDFFNAIHSMTNTPESLPARQVVQQDGATLANAISTRYTQLTTLQGDLNTQVGSIVRDINLDIKQIAGLNTQIAQSVGAGDNPNDLMDQRDVLVDKVSKLVDVRDVKNPDGTDTIQMNGRYLVNKDQAYTLTTLTDASNTSFIKPVKVFWQEDVTKFENVHPGYDPISGRSLSSNALLVAGINQPPLSVTTASVSTGSLAGALNIRDQVIQGTLLPQLNELADSLTNTQALSVTTGLTAATQLSGSGSTSDDFTITVVTPQSAATPPGPGQQLSFSVGSVSPTTVQNVIDAINTSVVGPFLHATLNSSGQLQLDTTVAGALVKVDKANGAASKDFGFSPTVADGFNIVHVQGYGLNTPAQWTGGISGLTLDSTVNVGDTLQVTGPDGQAMNIVVPPPVTTVFPTPTTTTVSALINTINAKGLSHGFQSALDGAGHLIVFASPMVYGQSGQAVGVPAQITGDNTAALTAATSLGAGDAVTVTGPGGTLTYTGASGDTLQTLLNKINGSNIGITASLNSVGQFQLTSQTNGKSQQIVLSGVAGQINTVLGLNNTAAPTITGSTGGVATTDVLNTGDSVTITGSGGSITYTVLAATNKVSDLIAAVNAANVGVKAAVSNGHLQFTSQTAGTNVSISNVGGVNNTTLGIQDTTLGASLGITNTPIPATTGLDKGFPPSAIITVADANVLPVTSTTITNNYVAAPVALLPAGEAVKVTLAGAIPPTVLSPGAQVSVTGIDKATGLPVTDTLAVTNPLGVLTFAAHNFTSVTDIAVTGISSTGVAPTLTAVGNTSATAITVGAKNITPQFTITQPTVPEQVSLTITPNATETLNPGAMVEITGIDAVTGQAVTEFHTLNSAATASTTTSPNTITTTHFFSKITGVATSGIQSATLSQLGPSNTQQDFFGGAGGLNNPVSVTSSNQFFFQGAVQTLRTAVVSPTSVSLNPTNSFVGVGPLGAQATITLNNSATGSAVFAAGSNVQITGVDTTTGQTITESIPVSATGAVTSAHTFVSVSNIKVNGVINYQAVSAGLSVTPQNVPAAAVAVPFVQLNAPSTVNFSISSAPGLQAIFASANVPAANIAITGVDAVTGQAVTDTLNFSATGQATTNHIFSSITSVTATGIADAQVQAATTVPITQQDTAGVMLVDSKLNNDPSLIAASNVPSVPGNAVNGLALLNIQQQNTVSNGQAATTLGDFYSTITEDLGAVAQQTHTNMLSQQQLVQTLSNQKQSIVGVSLDEEAARLVALQHAYQAAARAITTQDSMLETIITGMGLVGR